MEPIAANKMAARNNGEERPPIAKSAANLGIAKHEEEKDAVSLNQINPSIDGGLES